MKQRAARRMLPIDDDDDVGILGKQLVGYKGLGGANKS